MMQAHINYYGAVQGVGFRYTTIRHAKYHNINGWVKNLLDGSVEILAEGNKKDIDNFCEDIEQEFKGYISNKKINYSESQGYYKDFQITF